VTIKDVAALADVSISTASLVLNNRPSTTEAMRQKVMKAAETLDFRPNRMAQALRAGHGRHFAILVPDIANPFYGELLAGIATAARRIEHNVFITQSADHGPARDADLEAVFESRCAGLILLDVV
jgi:DNA-binding LacI/PurR family transcriptional regulator